MSFFNIKEIRPDIAKHIVVGQFISMPFILFSSSAFGGVGGIISAIACIVLFGLYELYQFIFKKGSGSFLDWIAGILITNVD